LIPFSHTCPYDTFGQDVYASECPFCRATNVLLPLKQSRLADIRSGKKTLLVFPCCRSSVYIVDCDRDYLLADRPLR